MDLIEYYGGPEGLWNHFAPILRRSLEVCSDVAVMQLQELQVLELETLSMTAMQNVLSTEQRSLEQDEAKRGNAFEILAIISHVLSLREKEKSQ
jgi:hypothetical protein